MLTKEFLEEEYKIKDRTAKDIGDEVGLSDTQIRYWLRKYGIEIKPRGGRRHTTNLLDSTIGEYTVLEQVKGNGHTAIWKCRCSCGTVKDVKATALKNGDANSCGKCKEHYAWKGCGLLSGHYYAILKSGANRRKIDFDISIEYLWGLFEKQNGKCGITGLDIHFTRNYTSEHKTQTASLDRIDSNKAYIIDNVRWVHKLVNTIKWNLSDEEFYFWCNAIAVGPLANKFHYDKESITKFINKPLHKGNRRAA